ncbi:MarR family winged helix-turn-helix transcriptional regulator [Streptomyces sp. CA-111067]|uniref:MarR family winged helix-turn-helix transcriptional regulator n=1 Tax=Streptomyces sp. CA-111067 TaxID=3240046 RepID=UPI003D9646E8
MTQEPERAPEPDRVAEALLLGVRLLVRRVRQLPGEGDLTLPETAALGRLDRGGPATSSEMAKLEQISPQSMGATLGGLEARGLIERSADPRDGRRVVLSISGAGRAVLGDRRNAKAQKLAEALADGFTPQELRLLNEVAPLLERLAQNL